MSEINYQNMLLIRSSIALNKILKELVNKKIETLRIARLCYFLLKSKVVTSQETINQVASLLGVRQHSDGGWADTVETVWGAAFFKIIDETDRYKQAISYIQNAQNSNGAWGKSERDMTRIPVTGTIAFLLPELVTENTKKWLQKEWLTEWNQSIKSISANYKAAYVIFGLGFNHEMTKEILHWLIHQNEPDGGWGPWRNHPIGSQTLYTALSMKAITYCQYDTDVEIKQAWENGQNFLYSSVKPYGLWPCHHIDEGSAWAFNALQSPLGRNV